MRALLFRLQLAARWFAATLHETREVGSKDAFAVMLNTYSPLILRLVRQRDYRKRRNTVASIPAIGNDTREERRE